MHHSWVKAVTKLTQRLLLDELEVSGGLAGDLLRTWLQQTIIPGAQSATDTKPILYGGL